MERLAIHNFSFFLPTDTPVELILIILCNPDEKNVFHMFAISLKQDFFFFLSLSVHLADIASIFLLQ